jgi:hypothetical protein
MRLYIIVLASLTLFGSDAELSRSQQPLNNQGFSLHFPRTIDTASLSIRYFLGGAFGGYGGFVRTEPDTWDYTIETSYEGKPAKTLKAFVFCHGYEVQLLDIPSLDDSADRSVALDLRPLPLIQLSGKVILPKPDGNRSLRIHANYQAYWDHEFFGLIDGAVNSFDVASAVLSEDGSFSMMVPDFAHDPAVNSFKDRGALELMIRDAKTGNIVYWLDRSGKSRRDVDLGDVNIQIADQYGELILYATPNR